MPFIPMHLADWQGKDKIFLTNFSNFHIIEFTYSERDFTELQLDFFLQRTR